MKAKPTIIGNRKMIHIAISMTTIMAMVFMVLLVKPIMADDDPTVCKTETVAAPDGSNADYTYKLDPDCTLHIGPANIPSRFVNYSVVYPIKQHDKVRKIVFTNPEQTSLNENSSHLFYGYPNAESIEGIDRLDVSHVTNFEYAFAGLNLKEPADLSSWNVSNAYNFESMFERSNLDGFSGIGNFSFDLSDEVQPYTMEFRAMFKNATSTNGIDLSGWTFLHPQESNGLSFNFMFDEAKTPKIDVSSFSDLDIGAGATGMFTNTNTDIEGLDKFPAHTMTDSNWMFENAKPTNQIDLSSWDTRKLENADSMFKGSDIDKFIGINHWKLPKLESANYMYANLNPTDQVRIPTNMPFLAYFQGMFENSDIDKFPDIINLQLKTEKDPYADARSMFGNAKGEYLNVAGWGMGKGFNATEMLESPYIKFMTFGDKIVGSTWITPDSPDIETVDFLVHGTYNSIFGSTTNVWDDSNLSTEYSSKKWATLPIKQECEAQFDGDPYKILDNCRDDNQWVSSSTGSDADNELFNSGNYHRIFFRVATISVAFNANGINGIENMPNSYHFDRLYKKNEELIPDNVPKDPSGGREFLSWNTKADGSGRTYHPGDHLGHDVGSLTLYAQWKTNTNTVNFIDDSNESSGLPSASTVVKGSDYTIPDQIPTRDGYTFEGWSTEKNGQVKYQPGDVLKITSNMELYAQWKVNNYSIRFFDMSKADDNLPDNAIVSHGSNYTIPNQIPRRYGYTFEGWATEDEGEVRYQPGDVLKITSDVNLYAQWKINNYSISFIDPSNESKDLPDKATSTFGSNYTIPNRIPTRLGYSFVGWATENGGQVRYQPGDVLFMDRNVALYATWAKKAPAINFNNNGGEGATPTTKPVENDNTKIEVDCTDRPSKDGATFIGWSKTKNDVLEGSEAGKKGQIAVCGYSGKRTITGLQGRTIDLYATWARKPKAVFKENRPDGMTALLPETRIITGDWYVDDSTPRTYVAPNIDGWYKGYSPDGVWQFDGWVNGDGSPFTGAYLERKDMTINAKWSKIKSADVPPEDNNPTDDNGQDHDDGNQGNKPSGDDSIDGSNSDNQNNNGDNTIHENPSSEEKPSVPENRPGSDGISSISNNSNQMNSGHSDSGDRSDIGDKDASGSSNSETVDDTADSDNGNKGSRLASTGANLIPSAVLIVLSTAVFMIVRRLKRKA